jgi:glucose-6-phosphate dehydrogenase assembly protein OpcA
MQVRRFNCCYGFCHKGRQEAQGFHEEVLVKTIKERDLNKVLFSGWLFSCLARQQKVSLALAK